MLNKIFLNISHQSQGEFGRKNASVLGLVFLENIGLDGTPNLGQGLLFDSQIITRRQDGISRQSQELKAQAVVAFGEGMGVVGLVRTEGSVSGPIFFPGLESFLFGTDGFLQALLRDEFLALLVDGGIQKEGQKDRSRSVNGHGNRGGWVAEVKAGVELFGIVQTTNADAGIADFAVDIRTAIRVVAVQGHRIKSRT